MNHELSSKALRRVCDPGNLSCDTVEDIKPLETIIGQDRAVKALRFGLGIKALGFNIYVSGQPGTGKLTAVKSFLKELAKKEPNPKDWCYVNNFQDPYEPKRLSLPKGVGKELRTDMKTLIEESQAALFKAFEGEEFANKREEILNDLDREKNDLFQRVEKMAHKAGFMIKHAPGRIITIPVKNGNAMSDEAFQALSKKEQDELLKKQEELQNELKVVLRQTRELEKKANQKIHSLEHDIALFAIKILIDELKDKYSSLKDVVKYLEDVQNDILENLTEFLRPQKPDMTQAFLPTMGAPFLTRYEVNVLIDNSETEGAPVIIELNPTYNNLFGRVEKESQMGALYTDFTLIRKGSLHQANEGYLVIQVEDLLRNMFSWDSLKRALRNKEIVIEDVGDRLGFFTTKTLQPVPVPLDVQVVLIGQPLLYYLLYEYDSDFKELFKVKADFDISMPFTKKNLNDYLAFACKVCKEENLLPLNNTALAKVIEHGSRLAEDQGKLSTQFGVISDIIREASYYANIEKIQHVNSTHVKKAVEEKFYRSNLIQEKINEFIKKGTIAIDHKGEVIGQVNGLSVIDLGDISFGRPVRITVSTGIGKEGVVDIEREAKLGGKIHTKGVLILSGFLTEKFAIEKPMSLSSRLVFEQSYSEIEGDSASSTELYAILSSLSGLPVKQGIAVTGSVNQKGEVQAIGGVNEKIEGFFEICKQKGLTGSQGVMIPQSNTSNLMLKEEVVESVSDKKFHIWAVKNVNEGIEVLTGVKAGKRKKDGKFEKDSVYERVEKRLIELSEKMEEYASKGEKNPS